MIQLYERRVIVLLENGVGKPEGFSQLIFDSNHFRKISNEVFGGYPLADGVYPESIIEFHNEQVGDRVIPLSVFEGMKSWT